MVMMDNGDDNNCYNNDGDNDNGDDGYNGVDAADK